MDSKPSSRVKELNDKVNHNEMIRLREVLHQVKACVKLASGTINMSDSIIFVLDHSKCIYARHPVTNKHATFTTVQDGVNFILNSN